MDPNANLAEQERILRRLRAGSSARAFTTHREDAGRLTELREALTEWITRGGFPPDWTCAPLASAYFASPDWSTKP